MIESLFIDSIATLQSDNHPVILEWSVSGMIESLFIDSIATLQSDTVGFIRPNATLNTPSFWNERSE